MRWHKRIRLEKDGVNLAADLDAAAAVNRAERGTMTKVESVSHARAVQNSRRAQQSSGAEHSKHDEEESR